MKAAIPTFLPLSALLLVLSIAGGAQQMPAVPNTGDPRVGLKPGLHDAGQAARNLELVSSLPKPEGFYDPKAPGGTPVPPERPERESNASASEGERTGAAEAAGGESGRGASAANAALAAGLNFANSDLAFSANHVFMGNFNGFNTYDIERPNRPKLLASIVCPGGQGDVSVHGHLLFMSVEQTRGRLDCGTGGVQETVSAERFRGIRIFDITDLSKTKQIADIPPCRG